MNKIRELEKNRYSILTDDMDHCFLCGLPKNSIHEIYFGKNRANSMIYGCCVPLCFNHHTGNMGVHNISEIDITLKKMCQLKFMQVYPSIDFIKVFHKNYI